MKGTASLLLLLFLPAWLIAQQSGKVYFLEQRKVEFKFEGMEHMKDNPRISEMRKRMGKSEKVLVYSQAASLYRDLNDSEKTEEVEYKDGRGGHMKMRMMMLKQEAKIYRDVEENRLVNQRTFMDKKFLIDDEEEKIVWKIAPEQKEILGYQCQKAIYKDTSRTVVAWFTPHIPVSVGPSKYGQLPGMILEVDIDEGELLITAQEFKFEDVVADAIEEPKKGKKVTREEFRAIVKEKREEMREEYGGGPGGHHRKIQISTAQ